MQETNRITVKAIDEIIGVKYPVLDSGFICVNDYMGGDESALRIYRRLERTPDRDINLINRMMEHYHTGPFEKCEIEFKIKCPIFVARQLLRTRTASTNEISMRDVKKKTNDFYSPDEFYRKPKSGRGNGELFTDRETEKLSHIVESTSLNAFQAYNDLVNDGVALEDSRIVLGVNTYTEFDWKIDLHNLLNNFLLRRLDKGAQHQIREYAEVMANIVERWVPLTWNAFEEYRLYAKTLSRKQVEQVLFMLEKARPHYPALGISSQEFDALLDKLRA